MFITPGSADGFRRRLTRDLKRRQRSETVRKVLMAMAEDPRVVVLKLADRLHNMRTLSVMNEAQQQNKARETREIYAPLARRLGMALVQAELEDLAFSYLEPEKYARLARKVAEECRKRQPVIEQICQALREEMNKATARRSAAPAAGRLLPLAGRGVGLERRGDLDLPPVSRVDRRTAPGRVAPRDREGRPLDHAQAAAARQRPAGGGASAGGFQRGAPGPE